MVSRLVMGLAVIGGIGAAGGAAWYVMRRRDAGMSIMSASQVTPNEGGGVMQTTIKKTTVINNVMEEPARNKFPPVYEGIRLVAGMDKQGALRGVNSASVKVRSAGMIVGKEAAAVADKKAKDAVALTEVTGQLAHRALQDAWVRKFGG